MTRYFIVWNGPNKSEGFITSDLADANFASMGHRHPDDDPLIFNSALAEEFNEIHYADEPLPMQEIEIC